MKKDFYIKVLVARTINVTLLMYMLNSSVANGFTVGATEGATCWGQIICKLISAANIYLFQPHHQKITAAGLGLVKYTYEEGSDSIIFAPDVIQSISDANARQDLDQAALYHFDNEVFLPSLTLLDIEYKELSNELSKEGAAISAAKAKELRVRFGRFLHTLQDFFSHTNWIIVHPGVLPKIWILSDVSNQTLIGPRSFKACVETPDPEGDPELNYHPGTGWYISNLTEVTSGYAGFGLYGLQMAVAPVDKCAHGLNSTGIHKDWLGRMGHVEAYDMAVAATNQVANELISNKNKNSVCMFMTGVPCGPDGIYYFKQYGGYAKITGTERRCYYNPQPSCETTDFPGIGGSKEWTVPSGIYHFRPCVGPQPIRDVYFCKKNGRFLKAHGSSSSVNEFSGGSYVMGCNTFSEINDGADHVWEENSILEENFSDFGTVIVTYEDWVRKERLDIKPDGSGVVVSTETLKSREYDKSESRLLFSFDRLTVQVTDFQEMNLVYMAPYDPNGGNGLYDPSICNP